MRKTPNIAGQRFGKLVALLPIKNKFGRREWLCRCDCGAHQGVTVMRLRSGDIKSCGCLRRPIHLCSKKPEYQIWAGMRKRCYCPSDKAYPRYGARGIDVSPEWDSFSVFLADMGERPSKHHSIDRINNDLGYSKENCRWATAKEQTRNTRSNVFLVHNGEAKCLTDWAAHVGMMSGTLAARLRRGWAVETALTTPATASRRKSA